MALIVTCKNLTDTIETLRQITRAIENGKIRDWEKTGTNYFRSTMAEYGDQACFSPTIKDNRLYFGLVKPKAPREPVTRAIYEAYHSMFYAVLVRLSWKYYFTVEKTDGRLEGIDAEIA
jgi:hypothetical protein